jgi:NADH dehydrogenase FAD-containing subunit
MGMFTLYLSSLKIGMLTYIGGWEAVADFSKTRLNKGIKGVLAWITWRSAYLSMSVSWKNKILIPMYWFLTSLFGRDTSKF